MNQWFKFQIMIQPDMNRHEFVEKFNELASEFQKMVAEKMGKTVKFANPSLTMEPKNGIRTEYDIDQSRIKKRRKKA